VSTTTVYGRRSEDLLVTDDVFSSGEGYAKKIIAGHLHIASSENSGEGVFLSRSGVRELRDLLDEWLAKQEPGREDVR
jgi:hypothetical protein